MRRTATPTGDHAEMVSNNHGLRVSLQCPDDAIRLFKFGSHVRARVVWVAPATPGEDGAAT
jgi:hypothetical protein